jgi:hypothetical protein
MCAAYGWTAADGPKPAFARAQLAEHVKGIVRGVERAAAEQAAVATVNVVDVPLTLPRLKAGDSSFITGCLPASDAERTHTSSGSV